MNASTCWIMVSDRYSQEPYETATPREDYAAILAALDEPPASLMDRGDGALRDADGEIVYRWAPDAQRVERLQREAAKAGDSERVELCKLALGGNPVAMLTCADLIDGGAR